MKLSFHLAFLILLLSFLFHSSFAILLRRISKQPSSPLYVQPTTFKDVTKCFINRCSKEATCTISGQTKCAECKCNSNYMGDGYECYRDACGGCATNEICKRVDSSSMWACYCLDGFQRVNGICTDINECDLLLHQCSPRATCENTQGSYKCVCPVPLKSDGRNCIDPNLCRTCVAPFSTCETTCKCKEGFNAPGSLNDGSICCPKITVSPNPVRNFGNEMQTLVVSLLTEPERKAKFSIITDNAVVSPCSLEFSATKSKEDLKFAFGDRTASVSLTFVFEDNPSCLPQTITLTKAAMSLPTRGRCNVILEHIENFDVESMTIQHQGTFILARNDDATFIVEATFTVPPPPTDNSPPRPAAATAVAVKYLTDVIFFYPKTHSIGCYSRTSPLIPLSSFGGTKTTDTCYYSSKDGYKVTVTRFDEIISEIEVIVPSSAFKTTKGLCGLFNSLSDDFRKRPDLNNQDGDITIPEISTLSWLVFNDENLFTKSDPIFETYGAASPRLSSCRSTSPAPAPTGPLSGSSQVNLGIIPNPNPIWANDYLKNQAELVCMAIVSGDLFDACLSAYVSKERLEEFYFDCLHDTRSSKSIDIAFLSVRHVTKVCASQYGFDPRLAARSVVVSGTSVTVTPVKSPLFSCPNGCHGLGTCPSTLSCKCKTGFSGTFLGKYDCSRVDPPNECLYNNGKCPADRRCEIINGRVDCSNCILGHKKEGENCLDDNECATNNGGCGDALCINTKGSHYCHCKPGFVRENQKCVDINECEVHNGGCHQFALCINTEGSRICVCKSGFREVNGECVAIDECNPAINLDPCEEGAKCFKDENERYECACLLGKRANYLNNQIETVRNRPLKDRLFKYSRSAVECT